MLICCYERFNVSHQKIDQKVNVFKEIKRKLSSFDKYWKTILFLTKFTSVLKNKLFIKKDVFNIKKIIFFKIIIQKIILNRTRENDNNSNN